MRKASMFAASLAGALLLSDGAAGYTILGSGTASCEAWTAARRTPHGPETTAQEQWVLGYLSGIGFMVLGELDPLRGMQADALHGWVDTYCRTNPQAKIEAAAIAFMQEHPR
jgi:hypothetical protein